jgi:hypothetical protein
MTFISEPITPAVGAYDTVAMIRGEPSAPLRFTWRNQEYQVARIVKTWKSSAPEGHKQGNDVYVRKHWFELETTTGERMTIYCDRQPSSRRNAKARWWLYVVNSEQ